MEIKIQIERPYIIKLNKEKRGVLDEDIHKVKIHNSSY